MLWKKSWRWRMASIYVANSSLMSMLLISASRSTQVLNASGEPTAMALSGRKAGNTLISSDESAAITA